MRHGAGRNIAEHWMNNLTRTKHEHARAEKLPE
jgi:hypothetical protein